MDTDVEPVAGRRAEVPWVDEPGTRRNPGRLQSPSRADGEPSAGALAQLACEQSPRTHLRCCAGRADPTRSARTSLPVPSARRPIGCRSRRSSPGSPRCPGPNCTPSSRLYAPRTATPLRSAIGTAARSPPRATPCTPSRPPRDVDHRTAPAAPALIVWALDAPRCHEAIVPAAACLQMFGALPADFPRAFGTPRRALPVACP